VQYWTVLKKITGGENHSKAQALPQSEIAGNEDHHHNNANDIKNIVHISSSFLSRDRMTLSQMPMTLLRESNGGTPHVFHY